MAKVKYFYDPETLSYRPIEVGKTLKVSNFFLFLISSLLFGVFTLFGLLTTDFLNTPKELLLERELNNYEFQFEILSQRLQQMENVMGNIENRDNEIYRTYFEANPIPQEQRRAGFGGVNRYKNLEGFGNSDQIIATTKKIDILSRMLVVQSNSLDEIQAKKKSQKKIIAIRLYFNLAIFQLGHIWI